jgi:hypothetical protein
LNRSRAPSIALGGAMLIASFLILWQGRGTSFGGDDLYYYARLVDHRGALVPQGFGLEYLLAPHNGHLQLIGKLIYEGLFATVGVHYFAFRVFELVGFLICVGLFFTLSRTRIGDPAALLASVLLLFCGAAWEVMLWPFDLHTVYALAAGLGALLALERGGRRSDLVCCALLVISIATIEVGLAFLVGAAVSVALRPDRWRRAWIVAVPLVLYGVWAVWAQRFGESELVFTNLAHLVPSVATSLAATVGSLTGQIEFGPGVFAGITTPSAVAPVLAVLVAAVLLYRLGRGDVAPSTWVLVATLLTYWTFITLADRAADSSRYIFPGAVLLLLIGADLARGRRFGRGPLIAIAAVVIAIALPANILKLADGRAAQVTDANASRAEYAMVELARERVDPAYTASADKRVIATAPIPTTGLQADLYLPAADRFGSIAYSLDELRTQDATVRAGADASLIGALRITLRPTGRSPDGAGCEPVALDGPTARLDLPPGGAVIEPLGSATVKLGLGRFDPESPGVPLGAIHASSAAELRIPPDSAPDPWVAFADGPVRLCPLGTPGSGGL